VQPVKVATNEASHPILDNLKIKKSSSGIRYQSLTQSIQYFLEQFPGGFYGNKFQSEEREYKDKAHNLAQELIGRDNLKELLKNKEYSEITKRALKVVNATNLIFPNEKMSLKDGLVSEKSQKAFSESLYELLFGNGEIKDKFESFSNVLENINAAKWTTASYFLFILLPEKYMFVKPTVTQHTSELCGFEINYKPQLNWLTYKLIIEFSNYLYSELAELNPRDMIDVQSFMWCIAPDKYQGV
jgi:hypothetical protein